MGVKRQNQKMAQSKSEELPKIKIDQPFYGEESVNLDSKTRFILVKKARESLDIKVGDSVCMIPSELANLIDYITTDGSYMINNQPPNIRIMNEKILGEILDHPQIIRDPDLDQYIRQSIEYARVHDQYRIQMGELARYLQVGSKSDKYFTEDYLGSKGAADEIRSELEKRANSAPQLVVASTRTGWALWDKIHKSAYDHRRKRNIASRHFVIDDEEDISDILPDWKQYLDDDNSTDEE